jgi:hypothetical protein
MSCSNGILPSSSRRLANKTCVRWAEGTVPERSTWALLLLGFAGLGFVGYRKARPTRALAA